MLGEQVGSLTASTINKPLSTESALPKFEVTATGGGTLLHAIILHAGEAGQAATRLDHTAMIVVIVPLLGTGRRGLVLRRVLLP